MLKINKVTITAYNKMLIAQLATIAIPHTVKAALIVLYDITKYIYPVLSNSNIAVLIAMGLL